jgi:hypothetical protein
MHDHTTEGLVDRAMDRRRFGRAVILGAGAAGVTAAVTGAGSPAGAAPVTDNWKLGGNSGVTESTNFLGTKDNHGLVIRTNNIERLRVRPNGNIDIVTSVGIGAVGGGPRRLAVDTRSTSGTAVVATAPNDISSALSAIGVQGTATVGVQGIGQYMGVQGNSTNYGVFGYTTPDTAGIGVYGRGGQGVKGRSYTGFAVLGDTDTGTGVKGEAYGDGGAVKAIHGENFGANGNGVVGQASNGTAAYGVWGISSTGYAGVFSGKALVTGTLAKGGGSFKIDHPLDPEHKYLSHSFVESPDMMNVYNGNVRTNADGDAVVELPDYFEALNRDFRYQLTPIGQFAQAIVSREVSDGSFAIRTDKPNVRVSWQVTGIRQDAFANANRIEVVEPKTADERGRLLHPEAFGRPASHSVQHTRLEAARTRSARHPDPVPPT